MDNNNKLPKPQEFELVELLFQEYIRPNIARPLLEYSFQARFQSFVNQIPSYLHSSSKLGFFTHFFFGSFATLLDIKLSEKIGIKKLHYNFDTIDTLRIVVETTEKTHIFIFIENSNKNNKKQTQNKQEKLEFTTGEWLMLKGRAYNTADKNNLEISVIKVNKSKGNIKVTVEKQNIKDSADSTKQYHEVTRQLVDEKGKYIYLDGEIPKLSSSQANKQIDTLKFVLKYIKKIYDHYQILPYAAGAQEADQHGFVAGIFNNFRYRENAHVYLEQFAGKGYADIVLLVRGAGRSTTSIPIIIELKAGSGSGTTFGEALAQAIEYTKGFQPNNMRILSLSNNILCVRMNLDGGTSSFMQMQLVTRNQEIVPLAQDILDTVKQAKVSNHDTIKKEIYNQLENTYHTFPGTGEKSTAHYFSRFIIGEVLVLQDYDKHIFMYDQDEYIPTKTIIDQHATRSKDSHATKKQGIEKIVDISNAITTTLLISKDQSDPAIILNIIDINREITAKNIPLDANLIGNRKIISLDIKFNIDKSSKEFKQYCDVKLEKVYNSVSEYNSANNERVQGNFKKIDSAVSVDLVARIKNAIDSQKGLIISENEYKELFKKIGEVIYPIKSLVNSEAEFQGLLEGTFKYYSDTKLAEGSESRVLILTEFQTGAGGRIDMLVQAIGESVQGTKEYTPIGLELKYDNFVKLSSFDKQQDEYIQGLILRDKEQKVVKDLLSDQTERYSQGAAMKSVTDSNKVAIMGVVFNTQAKDKESLLLTTDKFIEAHIVHSSKLYSISSSVNAIKVNDLPKPDSEYFRPDWVEHEIYDLLAKVQGDDDSILYLSNSALDDQTMKRLGDLLKSEVQVGQYIDGLDLSFNTVTASSVKELIKKFSKLVYLDLSDNDLGNNHLIDLEEMIKEIQVPILKIADVGMNEEQMRRVFESLKKQDKISYLEITHLDDAKLVMSSSTASVIAQYLRSTKNLTHLNLANNKIQDTAISLIVQGLVGQTTVSSLVLTNNDIGVEGAKKIADVLKDTVISNIDLSGNALGVRGVAAIAKGVKGADNIKSIELVNVGLKYDQGNIEESEELLSSVEILFKNKHVSRINIANNDIGNGGLAKIFKILSSSVEESKIEDLSLSGNKIDWGAHPVNTEILKSLIYDFLSQNEQIRSLDLSFMEIDDDIGERIVSALEKNVSLVDLDLGGNNHIGSETVKGLVNVLKTHQYLKYLNLSDNKLSITDLRLILGAITKNHIVSHINLSGNDFSSIINDDQTGKQYFDLNNQDIDFVNLLQGNTELKYLNLANCKLNQKSLLSLFKAIENNIGLEVLDIRDNEIENSIVDNIVESLDKNANQGLDIGLKVLHVSKGGLEQSIISKLTDKSLGISVLVEGSILPQDSLEERLMQTCVIDPFDRAVELDGDHQTFEIETTRGHYHYWLQAHDMVDIARVHYGYVDRPIEIIGSINQLSTHITQYFANSNNAKPMTMILNIGDNGQGGNHWVSLVLNRVGSQVHGYYIDSLGDNIASNIVSILNQHRILIRDFSTQQQIDGYNCGLWALENSRRICEVVKANRAISNEDIRNSLVRSRNEEEFEEIRDNILRELLNDNQRRVNLENIGLAQVELPIDYSNNYESYRKSQDLYKQCAMLAMMYSSSKIVKSKRSIAEINNKNNNKLLLDSKKFVDCAYDVKYDVVYFQLMSLINHFKVVGDNKSCKAMNEFIRHEKITSYLNKFSNLKAIPMRSYSGWSSLHKAAWIGNVEEAKRLIEQEGIDVNIGSSYTHWTPLHIASEYGNVEIVKLLIKNGANVNVKSRYSQLTPLHLAVKSNNIEMVKLLLKNDADITAMNQNHDTPLHLAIKQNYKNIIKYLAEEFRGENNYTLLHLAVKSNSKELVDLLTKNEANINAVDKNGNTPLHLAVKSNNIEMVKLLLKNDADITAMNQNHDTPLHLAIKQNYKNIIKYLAEEFRGENNYTLLHLAVKSNSKGLVDLLTKNEANINAVDKNGNTPLHLAVAMNNKELVKYLIEHNADVNAANKNGNTPLHLVVMRGQNIELVDLLIKNGANINAVDKNGIAVYILHNNNHISGPYKVRRDIEDAQQIVKDNQDNVEVISISSSGSNLKPIGYNMIKWIKDNVWKSINLNPIERIKNLLNVDDVKEKVKIYDLDVLDNVGYGNNQKQDGLVNKLSIIRSIEEQILELENNKIKAKSILSKLQHKVKIIEKQYRNEEEQYREYTEELSNRLEQLVKKRLWIQKQASEEYMELIRSEINNKIETKEAEITKLCELNDSYWYELKSVRTKLSKNKNMVDLIILRGLEDKIQNCAIEDRKLNNDLEKLKEELQACNALDTDEIRQYIRKLDKLNIDESNILSEEEYLTIKGNELNNKRQEIGNIRDQIKEKECIIEEYSSKLNELNQQLEVLQAEVKDLSLNNKLLHWKQQVIAQDYNDVLLQEPDKGTIQFSLLEEKNTTSKINRFVKHHEKELKQKIISEFKASKSTISVIPESLTEILDSDTQQHVRNHRAVDEKDGSEMENISDNIISSTASSISSPINNMISWFNKINWFTAENINTPSMGAKPTTDSNVNSTDKNSEPIKSVDYAQFNLNDSLTLADFIIRKITKVKPYITKEEPLNLLEVQAQVLNIIAGFEEILEEYAKEKDILIEELVFNPITLQMQLIKEIVNGSHVNIVKILSKSLEKTQLIIKNPELKNDLQDKVTAVLEKQQDMLLANEPLIDNRYDNQLIVENTDIFYHDIENYANVTTSCQLEVGLIG